MDSIHPCAETSASSWPFVRRPSAMASYLYSRSWPTTVPNSDLISFTDIGLFPRETACARKTTGAIAANPSNKTTRRPVTAILLLPHFRRRRSWVFSVGPAILRGLPHPLRSLANSLHDFFLTIVDICATRVISGFRCACRVGMGEFEARFIIVPTLAKIEQSNFLIGVERIVSGTGRMGA